MQTNSSRATAERDAGSSRPMAARARVETVVIYLVLALYIAFLLKLLLLSRSLGSERSINLIPFASIAHYLGGGSPRTAFGNVAGNVLIFIPIGAYLALLRQRATVLKNALVLVASSVAIEILQGIFAVGSSDIDDVILNSIGGLIGILAVKALALAFRSPARVRTTIAVLSLILAPVTCYLLFVIRLRM